MTHCIIGAGFSGLPIARFLKALGEDFEILDRNTGIGGLWHTGVYSGAHIISSRKTTQFPEFPMPATYPDFPSRDQMAKYLQDYATNFGLDSHTRLGVAVTSVTPTKNGWRVEAEGMKSKEYRTVTVANGHNWYPREVEFKGKFSGELYHSAKYESKEQLRGKRVLVVGYGNTGCDIAVDAATLGKCSMISMRSADFFFPKSMFGIPIADFLYYSPIHTEFTDRLMARVANWVAVGDVQRLGIPKPSRAPLSRHPIINTQLIDALRHGRITVKPEIDRLDGKVVHFVDGSSAEFDSVVCATGYKIHLPMVRTESLDWAGERPVLFMQLFSPKAPGLFFPGIGQARTGGGPIYQAMGEIFARLIAHSGKDLNLRAQIEAIPRLKLRQRLTGKPLVYPASLRSRGLGELRKGIRFLRWMCDRIGAPKLAHEVAMEIRKQSRQSATTLPERLLSYEI